MRGNWLCCWQASEERLCCCIVISGLQGYLPVGRLDHFTLDVVLRLPLLTSDGSRMIFFSAGKKWYERHRNQHSNVSVYDPLVCTTVQRCEPSKSFYKQVRCGTCVAYSLLSIKLSLRPPLDRTFMILCFSFLPLIFILEASRRIREPFEVAVKGREGPEECQADFCMGRTIHGVLSFPVVLL